MLCHSYKNVDKIIIWYQTGESMYLVSIVIQKYHVICKIEKSIVSTDHQLRNNFPENELMVQCIYNN